MSLLKPHPLGIPQPQPSLIAEPFWEGCRQGVLMYQRCDGCGQSIFDPAPICRWCTSSNLSWVQSAGLGAVYSFTIVWRPQTTAFEVPYVPAIIDLDEGYQMIANVIGCEPQAVAIGSRVEVEFHPISDDVVLPYFRTV